MTYGKVRAMQIVSSNMIDKPIKNVIKDAVGNGFFYCGFIKKKTGKFREGIFRFDVKQYKSIVDGEIKTIGDRMATISVNDLGMCCKEFYNKKYLKYQQKPHDFTSIRYDSIKLLKFGGSMYEVGYLEEPKHFRLFSLNKIPSEIGEEAKLLYHAGQFDFSIGDLPKGVKHG